MKLARHNQQSRWSIQSWEGSGYIWYNPPLPAGRTIPGILFVYDPFYTDKSLYIVGVDPYSVDVEEKGLTIVARKADYNLEVIKHGKSEP